MFSFAGSEDWLCLHGKSCSSSWSKQCVTNIIHWWEIEEVEWNRGLKDSCRDGAAVRALASHQCGSESIPGLGVICGLSLLLVLVLAPKKGFFSGYSGFSSHLKNQPFPNSNSIRNLRAAGLSKKSSLIHFYVYFKQSRFRHYWHLFLTSADEEKKPE